MQNSGDQSNQEHSLLAANPAPSTIIQQQPQQQPYTTIHIPASVGTVNQAANDSTFYKIFKGIFMYGVPLYTLAILVTIFVANQFYDLELSTLTGLFMIINLVLFCSVVQNIFRYKENNLPVKSILIILFVSIWLQLDLEPFEFLWDVAIDNN